MPMTFSHASRMVSVCLVAIAAFDIGCSAPPPTASKPRSTRYEDHRPAVRRLALVPAAEDRRWRAGLHRTRDERAGESASRLRCAARGDRSLQMAGQPAGGLAPHARGDERAGVRSPGAQALGEQPGVLRHRVSGPQRSAGARRTARVWRGRNLVVSLSVDRRERRKDGAGHPRDPEAARTGAREPGGQRQGPVDVRREGDSSAGHRSRRARLECARDVQTGRAASEGGDRRVRGVAGSADGVEDGTVGGWHRQLQLVPEACPARAVHVAGRSDDHAARAGALVVVPRARGAAERKSAARDHRLEPG